MSAEAQDADAKLGRKANQIADFFRPYPLEEAAAGVREHIQAFWTPAMRAALAARAAAGSLALDPIVLRALAASPIGAAAPGRHEAAGPAEAGMIGASDAG